MNRALKLDLSGLEEIAESRGSREGSLGIINFGVTNFGISNSRTNRIRNKDSGTRDGARYRVRTCDPYRVKVMLYH